MRKVQALSFEMRGHTRSLDPLGNGKNPVVPMRDASGGRASPMRAVVVRARIWANHKEKKNRDAAPHHAHGRLARFVYRCAGAHFRCTRKRISPQGAEP